MGLFGIRRPLEALRAAALAAAAAAAGFGADADAKEAPPDLRPLLRAEAGRPADQPEGGMIAERDTISNDAAKRFRAAFPEGGVGVVDLNSSRMNP